MSDTFTDSVNEGVNVRYARSRPSQRQMTTKYPRKAIQMTTQPAFSDGRLRGGTPQKREYTSAENDGRAYKSLQKLNRPASITDIWREMPDVAERTVRRSVQRLQRTGHVVPTGKDGATILYGVKDAQFANTTEQRMIPFAGQQYSIEDFLALMVNPSVDPFKPRIKLEMWDADFIHWLRRRMAIPIITAGDNGFDQQLMQTQEGFIKVKAEVERMLVILDGFINSPVWYEHFRDRLAFERREVEKENPELIKLTMDYIQNKG